MRNIKRIQQVSGMGIYNSKECVETADDFLKYNLIYGFNGSGKTTLSRMFESLSTGTIHDDLPKKTEFLIELADGATIDVTSNLDLLKDKILVFNSDFVRNNFRWEQGTASSIVYLGSAMSKGAAELSTTAKLIEAQEKTNPVDLKKLKKQQSDLAALFTKTGALIKKITKAHHYNATNVKKDYKKYDITNINVILEDDYINSIETLKLQEPKPDVKLLEAPEKISDVIEKCSQAINENVTLNLAEDLKGLEEILSWIQHGLEFHKENELEECKFCGNELTSDRISALQLSVSNNYEEAISNIDELIEKLDNYISNLKEVKKSAPKTSDVYPELATQLDEAKTEIYEKSEQAIKIILEVKDKLNLKKEDISTKLDINDIVIQASLATDGFLNALTNLNSVIQINNGKNDNFVKSRRSAFETCVKYNLIQKREDIKNYQSEINELDARCSQNKEILAALISKKTEITNILSDEGKAASIINKLLLDYLGHSELTLVFETDGYKILRHGEPISGTISDGEKTAFSFCYFISKMNERGNKTNSRIFVIDDPISSLDSKAQNFACGLVKRHLEDAGQLFILTHNLHFMNECKKWLRGRAQTKDWSGNEKTPTAKFYFLNAMQDEVLGRRTTRLKALPKLLAQYDTEYHFLFSQIYSASVDTEVKELHSYYTLPNVIRKTLETFFAFKFPRAQSFAACFDQKDIKKTDIPSAKLEALKRLSELESHGQSVDNVTNLSAINVEEVISAATTTMELISKIDPSHFKEMKKKCDSIAA